MHRLTKAQQEALERLAVIEAKMETLGREIEIREQRLRQLEKDAGAAGYDIQGIPDQTLVYINGNPYAFHYYDNRELPARIYRLGLSDTEEDEALSDGYDSLKGVMVSTPMGKTATIEGINVDNGCLVVDGALGVFEIPYVTFYQHIRETGQLDKLHIASPEEFHRIVSSRRKVMGPPHFLADLDDTENSQEAPATFEPPNPPAAE